MSFMSHEESRTQHTCEGAGQKLEIFGFAEPGRACIQRVMFCLFGAAKACTHWPWYNSHSCIHNAAVALHLPRPVTSVLGLSEQYKHAISYPRFHHLSHNFSNNYLHESSIDILKGTIM